MFLQLEYFLPARRQSFVLGVGEDSIVAELDDAERVRLAADVGRSKSLSLEHFHHQVANVFHVVKGVGWLLQIFKIIAI